MATSPLTVAATTPQIPLEDPLEHLPRSEVLGFRKGQLIYGPEQPSNRLYLVIEGKVKVSRRAEYGREVVVDIYGRDEFFGEAAFIGQPQWSEEARAFENSRLMAWSVAEIDALTAKQPRLMLALLQILIQRNVELTQRIESFSVDDIGRRVARTLKRLSERMGTPSPDGSIQLVPLTHELLSKYVGTSREVVTLHMNRFRRKGYLRYSRRGMVLYPGLAEWLRSAS